MQCNVLGPIFALVQNEAALLDSQAEVPEAEHLKEEGQQVGSEEQGLFSKRLEAGCSPSAFDDLDLADENPAEADGGHEAGLEEVKVDEERLQHHEADFEEVKVDEEELQHYAASYEANYTTASDGSSHQYSQDLGCILLCSYSFYYMHGPCRTG